MEITLQLLTEHQVHNYTVMLTNIPTKFHDLKHLDYAINNIIDATFYIVNGNYFAITNWTPGAQLHSNADQHSYLKRLELCNTQHYWCNFLLHQGK